MKKLFLVALFVASNAELCLAEKKPKPYELQGALYAWDKKENTAEIETKRERCRVTLTSLRMPGAPSKGLLVSAFLTSPNEAKCKKL